MPLAELVRSSWSTLRAHKLRSFLTALGVIIAVWTIVSVVSVISGMNEYVRSRIFFLSPDVFVVTRFGIITNRDEFLEANKRKAISEREAEQLIELCESCGDVGKTLTSNRRVHSGRWQIKRVRVVGTTANVASLQNLDIDAGRYFTDSEEQHAAAVAVIGSEVLDELFPRLDPIGRKIWVGGRPHRVIGTLKKQGSILGQSQDAVVYTPYKTARKQFGRTRGLDNQTDLLVRAAGGIEGVDRCQEEVVQIFRWLRHTPFRASDPVGVVTAEAVQMFWRGISLSTFAFVFIISSISLVVGAIVIANIMLVSVMERINEIGVRRALGARRRDIMWQFLIEAAVLASFGGAVGSLAGAVTAWVVASQTPVPAIVRPEVIAVSMAIATITGILAGLFPARKASRLTPIEALHNE